MGGEVGAGRRGRCAMRHAEKGRGTQRMKKLRAGYVIVADSGHSRVQL